MEPLFMAVKITKLFQSKYSVKRERVVFSKEER